MDPRGSVWRKWDLHVHTPASLVHNYTGADAWDRFLRELEELPPEFKVLGINDYIFLDGYRRILQERAKGRLKNIDLVLPVIELRLDKFGGSHSHFSRVNYHVIFSNELPPETIEQQFLSALSSKYVLTPQYDSIRTSGKWVAVPARQSLVDLGQFIIGSVPKHERAKFGPPLIEGFNNLCISLAALKDALSSHYFRGKTITAVGKTEWAGIKWTDHSIADKKTIINDTELVFISAASPQDWKKAKDSLTAAGVNDRLLDCSDAHTFSNSDHKDRLGKCFTWIKADPTFEGLRQAIFDYRSRVAISLDRPIEPLLCIRRVTLNFPDNTQVTSASGSDNFCFRGNKQISFSPYLTCIIGGRGTGKSTLLNLLHEKLASGETRFFKDNTLAPQPEASIPSCVSIDEDEEQKVVEFLQQNEIEQFAMDPSRFTSAIFSRLNKRDVMGTLYDVQRNIEDAVEEIEAQIDRLKTHHLLAKSLADGEKELATRKALIESFQNDSYKKINEDLGRLNKELQSFRNDRKRLETLVKDLRTLIANHPLQLTDTPNAHEKQIRLILSTIEQAITAKDSDPEILVAKQREIEISEKVTELKDKMDEFLRGRGLSVENLADVGNASERVAELEQEIPVMKARAASLSAEITAFTPKRALSEDYSNASSKLLLPINALLQNLSAEVKPIKLQYEFDFDALRESLIQHITQELSEESRVRIDHVGQMLEGVDFINLSSSKYAVSQIPADRETGKALRDYLSKDINFENFRLEVEKGLLDVETYGRIRVSYDGKPVENTSFGQRCTAAIVVLLLLGNSPIVVDEPEAHLDSALIAKYLVELVKETKNNRQIIFATHNANFVINGDAELIHVLSMSDDKITQIVSTTIENLEHRGRLLALEGGKEAFQKRELRYGIE